MATRPIHPDGHGPVLHFARSLRELRDRAGQPSLKAMAGVAFMSAPTLSAVHTGKTFPTWNATRAYLHGCGVPDDQAHSWQERWLDTADVIAYRGPRPDDRRASTVRIQLAGPPACDGVTTIAEFRDRLRLVLRWACVPSRAELIRRAEAQGLRLPRATVSDMLRTNREHHLPSASSVQAFLTACGVPADLVGRWMAVHRSLAYSRSSSNRVNAGYVSRGAGHVAGSWAPSQVFRGKATVTQILPPGTARLQSPPPEKLQSEKLPLASLWPSVEARNAANLPGAALLAGRYRLVERLGAGGMSVVWRGFDEVLGRQVAVKVLPAPTSADPSFRRRLRAEAQAAARLSHPHITNIYDYGEGTTVDGEPVPYVVMELVDGESLAAVLARSRRLPWPATVRICSEVSAALAAAHARGVVHRDITPANVMLTPMGATVVDFGISAVIGENDCDPDGSLLGTPAYLAPERLEGGQVSPATDVYAVGLLIYRILIGNLPWDVGTTTALLRAHQYTEPEPMPPVEGLPSAVSALVARCLEKRPSDRPSSAELAHVLGTLSAGVPAARAFVSGWADEGVNATILPDPVEQDGYQGRHRRDPEK